MGRLSLSAPIMRAASIAAMFAAIRRGMAGAFRASGPFYGIHRAGGAAHGYLTHHHRSGRFAANRRAELRRSRRRKMRPAARN